MAAYYEKTISFFLQLWPSAPWAPQRRDPISERRWNLAKHQTNNIYIQGFGAGGFLYCTVCWWDGESLSQQCVAVFSIGILGFKSQILWWDTVHRHPCPPRWWIPVCVATHDTSLKGRHYSHLKCESSGARRNLHECTCDLTWSAAALP